MCKWLTLKVLVTTIDALGHFKTGYNYSTVGGDGGCRVGEVRAGTTSPMSLYINMLGRVALHSLHFLLESLVRGQVSCQDHVKSL